MNKTFKGVCAFLSGMIACFSLSTGVSAVEPELNEWGLTGPLADLEVFMIMPGNQLTGASNEYGDLLEEILISQRDGGFNLTNFARANQLAKIREVGGLKTILKDFSGLTGTPLGTIKPWYNNEGLSAAQIDLLAKALVESGEGYEDIILMYYIKDEPSSGKFAQVKLVKDALNQYAPGYAYFVNLLPSAANATQLGVENIGTAADRYRAHLDLYRDIVGMDQYIRFDNYGPSFGNEGGKPERMTDYLENMMSVRQYGLTHHIPVWNTGAACQMRQEFTLFPAPHTLNYYVYTTLMFGYKGLGWFSYNMAPPTSAGLIGYPEAPFNFYNEEVTQTWYYLREANRQASIIGNRMMKMQSTKMYFRNMGDDINYTPTTELGAADLQGDVLSNVTSVGNIPVGVGEFRDVDGSRWAMVMNLSLHDNATVNMTLASGFTTMQLFSTAGGEGAGKLMDYNPVDAIDIAPGMGYLFKIS